jgi:RNA ligase
MTLLLDIMDIKLLNEMKEQKYVREQVHPHFSRLRILNYTESAAWENVWNEVTLQCRGLIYDIETAEVLARPFRKFFNHEQEQAPTFSLDDRLHVTEKADGSLGILYRTPEGQWAIATRGSFASDQALWATAHFQQFYAGFWEPEEDLTYLFEIVYPENRIVVDYYGWDGLILLGAVDISTGKSVPPEEAMEFWPGPAVEIFHLGLPLGEILAMPPRENAEGFVLWHPESDERVKIKYEDYKVLHKFLTNTSEKHVWEALSQGLDMDETFAGAPDEFHEWLREVIFNLETQYDRMEDEAITYWDNVRHWLPEGYTRKEFALSASKIPNPYRPLVFLLEDDKSIDDFIWKQLKPAGATTFKKVDSEAD